MSDIETLLSQGIDILCKNDSNFNSVFSQNKKEKINTLLKYIKEIENFNPVYKLVGTNNTSELVIKHILDSIAPLGIISKLLSSSLCAPASGDRLQPVPHNTPLKISDAGSGAGLPGIPLAVCLPECQFTLIERMGRRAGFLLNTKAVLELSNINIEESELEKCAAQFDLITFRAFAPIEPKILKILQKLLKPGGIIAAYKGKREKIVAEMTSLKRVGAPPQTDWERVPYTVPFLDEERNLLVIKQI